MPDSTQSNLLPRLHVIVLNYRTADLTVGCLQSLVDEVKTVPGTHVTVVDNASSDGSVEKISAAIQQAGWDWVTFMPLEVNGGYAFGNNVGIRAALDSATPPPYILLLNPDTLVRPGALKALVDFMDAHPQVGIAGSRLEDLDGTPQHSAFRFPSIWSEFDQGLRLGIVSRLLSKWWIAPPISEVACETEWVAGASMIVRREVFETVGLMDEKYFLYFEEMDFCLAVHRAGWPCWYVPDSRVVHFVGQSSGITDTKRQPKRRPTYWFDSRRRYFVKNYGWLYAVLSEVSWASGFALWQVRRMVQRKPDIDPPNLLSDFLRNSVLLKGAEI
jgi:GT2 family glycosyltransferase